MLNIRKNLSEYLAYHDSNNFEFPKEFRSFLTEFLYESNNEGIGGLKYNNKKDSSSFRMSEFSTFLKSRVRVRNFSSEPITDDILHSIVEVAKSAPSVCNRQSWKVHQYSNKKDINEILIYQNGNLGFTGTIDKLLIVTGDAKAFTSYESNQIFIDGGLFSMNLLLAIQAAGLGACALNTCYPLSLENKVKKVALISKVERLIMMIAVGCLKDSYGVAYSARNPTKDILIKH